MRRRPRETAATARLDAPAQSREQGEANQWSNSGGFSMLVDVRTYQVRAGTLPLQMALYEKHGLGPQTKNIGQPFAYLTTETGELNTFMHMWAYESAADRETKRAAMMADAGWKEYLRLNSEAGYLIHQENKLMVPASFAPIKR
jgi:hypothetical protein